MITLTNPEALPLLVCAVLALICAYAFGWANGHESRCDSCNLEPEDGESQDEKNRRMAASLAAMPLGAGSVGTTVASGVDWNRMRHAPDTESAVQAMRNRERYIPRETISIDPSLRFAPRETVKVEPVHVLKRAPASEDSNAALSIAAGVVGIGLMGAAMSARADDERPVETPIDPSPMVSGGGGDFGGAGADEEF